MISFEEFEKQYTGVPNVGNTPENLGQCVGLVETWIDTLGLKHIWGNARDLLNNADASQFIVIANSPTNAPSAGDIVCLGKPYGEYTDSAGGVHYYGHTGIATKNCNDAILELFEANDPVLSPPHIKQYSYNSCLGWLHPRVLSGTQTTEVPLTTEQVQSQLQTQIEATSSCLTQLKTASEQVSQLQGQLALEVGKSADLTDKLAALQLKCDESAKEVIAINGSLEMLAKSNKEYAQDALDAEHLATHRLVLIESIAQDQGIKTTGLKDDDISEKILAQNAGDRTLMQAQHEKIQAMQKIKLVTPQVIGDIKKNSSLMNFLSWAASPFYSRGD